MKNRNINENHITSWTNHCIVDKMKGKNNMHGFWRKEKGRESIKEYFVLLYI